MTPMESLRSSIVDFLETELVGPHAPDEELDENPIVRYSAGVLFPGGHVLDENEDWESADAGADSNGAAPQPWVPNKLDSASGSGAEDSVDEALDSPVQLANAHYPSAMGLSFICRRESDLTVRVKASTYSRVKRERESDGAVETVWRRSPICKSAEPTGPLMYSFRADPGDERVTVLPRHEVVEGLSLHVTLRARDDDLCLVTVALWNSRPSDAEDRPDAGDCFFQCAFRVDCDDGRRDIVEYRLGTSGTNDSEEDELRLLYRERRAFAVGHGCAPEWPKTNLVAEGKAAWVETAALPRATVLPLEASAQDAVTYRMDFLWDKSDATTDEVLASLRDLPEQYEAWLDERQREAEGLANEYREAATANLGRCRETARRIRSGIDALASDDVCLTAFRLANRAMLLQQVPEARRALLESPESEHELPPGRGRWRVFQLAFILMNIRSIAGGELDPTNERDLVDLIWFPTGGGKTEAYLGLTAFAIFLRRMRNPADRGCAALMRYTLRLLTSQQFERAAALIAACEYLRREGTYKLGPNPITIGLWAGDKLTPNRRVRALTLLREWSGGEGRNPFQLLKCPWCGRALDETADPGYREVGRGQTKTVRFRCTEGRCPMGGKAGLATGIPAIVIDEDIYDDPPTLLIGTVDKFAVLAWNDDAGVLLTGDGGDIGSPDLIIQDELHLISGPLGTVVGLYEAAIDKLCRAHGTPPKIISSTATIRHARVQCRKLFNRDTRVFPPSALSIRDSWFATEKSDKTGRLYVGVFGSAAPSYATLMRQAIAALTFAPSWVALPPGLEDKHRDAYWTLVWYFNSLRALGRGGTMIDADIREHLRVIRRRMRLSGSVRRPFLVAEEMNSRKRGDEIPEILRRLGTPYTDEKQRLDVLLATNMISVGVDVPRLGLMAVTGQPKTTAEYIQATSRVGRDARAPGLVVALYGPGKSRDRSHYEQFRSYHESFYRFVEPTSVTPFSIPAIDRALHALIVILARHHPDAKLRSPDQLDPDAKWLVETRDWLVERAESTETDPVYVDALKKRFDTVVEIWKSRNRPRWGKAFASKDELDHLLLPAGSAATSEGGGRGAAVFDVPFPTPTSMRSVDVECSLRVMSQAYAPGYVDARGDQDEEE